MTTVPLTWVVYLKLVPPGTGGHNAVCDGDEWASMERERPGHQPLLRGGFATEPDAEKYARSGPGSGVVSAPARTRLRRRKPG